MQPGATDDHRIRRVAPADEAEWLRLRLAMWPEDSVEAHRVQMADVLSSRQQAAIVIARPGGGLGGFVETSVHPRALGCATHHIAYVEGWYIDGDLRGQGWGRRLMLAAEDWGREIGATEIASDTQIDNEVSLRAHLRLGYAECGRLIHFVKRLGPPGS